MTYIGYHYMGFESAVIKKIPQKVTNNPIVISKVVSVYDGGTFRVDINGYPDIIGKNIPIRVNAIDTPEIKGQCDYEKQLAIKAKYFTSALLSGGTVELRNAERGKYFRIAADVYVDGVSLGNSLIDAGLAYKYDKKKDWCEK
jgi:micrococcal nuclease